MILRRLIDYLSEISSVNPIIPSLCGHELVIDFFALKKDGTTYAGNDIYGSLEIVSTLCEKA